MKLVDCKIKEFNEKLAGGSATPGGGSVAALAASLSAALVSMVVNLTRGDKLNKYGEKAVELCKRAEGLIDEDTESYNKVMAAYKMSKETENDKKARKKAIQTALKGASMTPLETMKISLKLLQLARKVIENCNPNAISDVGVGAEMGLAALKGGYYNVMINVVSLEDKETADKLRKEAEKLFKEGQEIAEEISRIKEMK